MFKQFSQRLYKSRSIAMLSPLPDSFRLPALSGAFQFAIRTSVVRINQQLAAASRLDATRLSDVSEGRRFGVPHPT